mmetsp:Transcript_24521/g.11737  ORF Transcript_24521/g.11737 Transcript_24521/m.11737 type:complete len:126 (+) Transcript_24521:855-1232(+)
MKKKLSHCYQKSIKRLRRKKNVRKKIFGDKEKPRLTVYRSLKHIYAQIIDDKQGKTLISCSTLDKNLDLKSCKNRVEIGFAVGRVLGKKALESKIKNICFDKNGYKYHGRVKSLADGARDAGLKF